MPDEAAHEQVHVLDCTGISFAALGDAIRQGARVHGDHLDVLLEAVSLLLSAQPAVQASQQSGPGTRPVHASQLLRSVADCLTDQSMYAFILQSYMKQSK